MEQICFDVLEKWAVFTNYDAGQTCFNRANWEYETHRLTETISHITDVYDNSGLLAVIAVKKLFDRILRESRVTLFEAVTNREGLNNYIEMQEALNSKDITVAENNYCEKIRNFIGMIIGEVLLGKFDEKDFNKKVFGATPDIISTLDKCNVEFYKKGGAIENITLLPTGINVFPSLAECVISLSDASDGMYLCYIDVFQSADSYFGFFIKSNGNIFSFNDRADEAFKGQHCNSRNGRWSEKKADAVFPYSFIFEYGDYDYKGYSHSYKIDENRLSLYSMETDALISLAVSMMLLSNRIRNINVSEYKPVYIDSLLKNNMHLLGNGKHELAVIEKNEIVQRTNAINLAFNYDMIMSGEALSEFTERDACVDSKNKGQIFVDLYGNGFVFDADLLSTQKLLGEMPTHDLYGKIKNRYIPEFIGSEGRLRAQAYCEIRKQLAGYIREKMYEEYISFGKMPAVDKWFTELLDANTEKIKRLAVKGYMWAKEAEKKYIERGECLSEIPDTYTLENNEERYSITVLLNTKNTPNYKYRPYYLINKHDNYQTKAYDMDTGAVCSIFCVFCPEDYIGLENLFGDVPKIVKGWKNSENRTYGNPLLDMTDAVEGINAPFEYYCSLRPEYHDENTHRKFAFVIGFSKRRMNRRIKEIQENET